MKNRKKHIVFISPYSHNNAHAGARRRVEALCRAMLSLEVGHDIKITCLSPWVPPSGVEHIPFTLDLPFFKRLVRSLWLNFGLVQIKPDIVLSEAPLSPIPLFGCKVFHVIHDAKFASNEARRGGALLRHIHWISSRIATKVLTVSSSERDRIAKSLGLDHKKIIVSYNGLSDQWYEPPKNIRADNREFDVLYVSNFAKHKRHLNLLFALRNTDLKLAFVGADFGKLNECKEVAERWGISVDFMCGLNEDELIDVYDNSKCFAFPSKLEGFGMPFLEARARGLPVIAENLPVFRELKDIVGGSLVDFNDHPQVTASIFKAASKGLRQPPAEISAFHWHVIAADLLSKAGIK